VRRDWLLLAVVLVACSGNLEDRYFVYGRATTVSAAPLVDQPLRVNTHDRLTDEPSLLDDVATDRLGRYSIELYRFQLMDAENRPRSLSIEVNGRDGAMTRLRFIGQALDQGLPDLLLWDVSPSSVVEHDGELLLQTPSFPLEPLGEPTEAMGSHNETRSYGWLIESQGLTLWAIPADLSGVEVRLPREVLEDFAAPTARFSMQTVTSPPRDPLLGAMPSVHSIVLAGPAVLSSGPGTPVTRGRPCWLRGDLVPGCPATDGDFDGDAIFTNWIHDEDLQPLGELIRFDLGTPRQLRLLMVRGLSVAGSSGEPVLAVEGSNDLLSWTHLGAVSPGSTLVELDPLAPPVQFVRLTTQLSTTALTLQELSLYE
jgi:hypothetical protein